MCPRCAFLQGAIPQGAIPQGAIVRENTKSGLFRELRRRVSSIQFKNHFLERVLSQRHFSSLLEDAKINRGRLSPTQGSCLGMEAKGGEAS